MQTPESNPPPAERGIHRRAGFAQARAALASRRARRYAWAASIFVFVLCLAVIDTVSPWAVGVALALLLSTVLLTDSVRGTLPIALLAVCLGQWATAGGLLPAGLIWALWLPAFAHSRKASVLWTLAIALPLLWHALPAQSAVAAGVLMGCGVGWYITGVLRNLRQRQGESLFDASEANAVILELQGQLQPLLNHAESHGGAKWAIDVVEHAHDIVIAVDANDLIVHCNRAAQSMFGLSTDALVGTPLQAHVAWMDPHSRAARTSPVAAPGQPDDVIAIDDALLTLLPGGIELSVEGHVQHLHEPAHGHIRVVTLCDNSELRDAERMARFYAMHDDLTGLPRLRMMQADLRTALSQSRPAILTLVDVDRYGSIIDNLGFDAGNALIREAAARIQSCLRDDDRLYRLGLDLFGVVSGAIDADAIEALGKAMCEQVGSVRVQIGGQSHRLTASVGIVELNASLSPDVLLARASVARSLAKRAGGNRVHVYRIDDPLAQQMGTVANWTSRLHQAIEENRLVLYVQPMLPLADDLPTRAELLLRLTDEDGSVWAPDHFMPAAERHHLMPEIDRWVINFVFDALTQANPALDAYQSYALNLSGQSLSDAGFRADVLALAQARQSFARRICFEVTESVLLVDLPEAAHLLTQLKALGYAVALDDFGAGYSSYAYLKQLPADVIKIDGSFIVDMQRDAVDRAMVDSINRLAHRLGMYTVAEHVRDKETLESLRHLGIDYAQGDAVGQPKRLF